MSDEPKRACRDCVAYFPKNGTQGLCRADTPKTVVVTSFQAPTLSHPGPPIPVQAMYGTWPPVDETDWCLQFKPSR